MNVATFPAASLQAQLAELQRDRSDRLTRRDAMDLSSKRATSHEIAHRNNALDGAIKTLTAINAAAGQPGRRELIDALRTLKVAVEDDRHIEEASQDVQVAVSQADLLLARIPT